MLGAKVLKNTHVTKIISTLLGVFYQVRVSTMLVLHVHEEGPTKVTFDSTTQILGSNFRTGVMKVRYGKWSMKATVDDVNNAIDIAF